MVSILYCSHLGTCHDEVNNFRCDCPAGYLGKTCKNTTNECQINPCRNGGSCHDLHRDYNVSSRILCELNLADKVGQCYFDGQNYNHGQNSWNKFALVALYTHAKQRVVWDSNYTCPAPPPTPPTLLKHEPALFSDFQRCIGWGRCFKI